ncbi:hypothetical protein ACIGNX_01820 [Actinosynnema sp. NPDC053489]|uniref:hypothetical protein n=1 Tax=Actinosynnema sp. NPDC053489 TaxID=3363916 RepID=UPI0037CC4FE4
MSKSTSLKRAVAAICGLAAVASTTVLTAGTASAGAGTVYVGLCVNADQAVASARVQVNMSNGISWVPAGIGPGRCIGSWVPKGSTYEIWATNTRGTTGFWLPPRSADGPKHPCTFVWSRNRGADLGWKTSEFYYSELRQGACKAS